MTLWKWDFCLGRGILMIKKQAGNWICLVNGQQQSSVCLGMNENRSLYFHQTCFDLSGIGEETLQPSNQ